MNRRQSEPEDTGEAPIVIHRPAGTGGRRVTIRAQVAGLARSDHDVIEFLRRAGLPDAGDVLDDPQWVQWQGGSPHEYGAASVDGR
ncbi:hypothetical protein ACFYWN_00235 [Streptomyces sp. NPDC002917]|uniref:hypothetical protein n=1 Tax=unclassified Streptomyces TaxID=2593676 RepID=UPI002E81E9F5|nr:hypothetical protein [Streptomyces sp. NBC_00562]WTC79361.1 hypothetical protein OH719_16750 [Streptomyces sp. NBC_01653]WTD36091.1 hypothetical protein OHB03_29865 [Streptomyces sp. NBC_01643]WTD91503.1 hypothetical protein OG891_30125 [Streptomyces sp. NBC_01637]WUC22515.1 hypothetical protein OHA33_28645 [Streptomyces sp. NBC_00562]